MFIANPSLILPCRLSLQACHQAQHPHSSLDWCSAAGRTPDADGWLCRRREESRCRRWRSPLCWALVWQGCSSGVGACAWGGLHVSTHVPVPSILAARGWRLTTRCPGAPSPAGADPALAIMGTAPDSQLYGYARDYLVVRATAAPAALLMTVGQGAFRGMVRSNPKAASGDTTRVQVGKQITFSNSV